jgi:hypothetical protein
MKESLALVLLLIGSSAERVWADFAGPLRADNAASPDGKLVVRVLEDESAKQTGAQRSYLVRFYEFDVGKDSYVRCSEFRMKERPGQLAFLSNAGDVVMISLRETDAI